MLSSDDFLKTSHNVSMGFEIRSVCMALGV